MGYKRTAPLKLHRTESTPQSPPLGPVAPIAVLTCAAATEAAKATTAPSLLTLRGIFHRATVPEVLVGRAEERAKIVRFIDEHLRAEKPGGLYISGSPGTGKTVLVDDILKQLSSEGLVRKPCARGGVGGWGGVGRGSTPAPEPANPRPNSRARTRALNPRPNSRTRTHTRTRGPHPRPNLRPNPRTRARTHARTHARTCARTAPEPAPEPAPAHRQRSTCAFGRPRGRRSCR